MKDFKSLIGLNIVSAKINPEKTYVILTESSGKLLHLTWNGDCCAKCFLAHVSGADSLVGQILSVEDTKWNIIKEDVDSVEENMGTTIRTSKGVCTFESRLEHNGYYSGSIDISEDGSVDQYGSIELDELLSEGDSMKKLEDF